MRIEIIPEVLFLNNVAIGALHAIGIYGLKRVAVVDFDVHHGDGTSNILGGRDDVLILDGFQEALFPYAHIHHAPRMQSIHLSRREPRALHFVARWMKFGCPGLKNTNPS